MSALYKLSPYLYIIERLQIANIDPLKPRQPLDVDILRHGGARGRLCGHVHGLTNG